MRQDKQSISDFLPSDAYQGTLIARVWLPASFTNSVAGPAPVILLEDGIFDLSDQAATVTQLINQGFTKQHISDKNSAYIGSYSQVMSNTLATTRNEQIPYFLSPIDLQAIKACGVTFMCSMLERIIEEGAGGDFAKAAQVRVALEQRLEVDIADIVPGSDQAMALKEVLISQGLWSQYLEVGIGPYAEVFTKSQPLSSVGVGDAVGIHPVSSWNNPEPEVVLIVNDRAEVVGATLGNDVNLRDIEGMSALLLGKAKDNNASCAIGPFIRLFDHSFNIDDVRTMELSLQVTGEDGFALKDVSLMDKISRDVLDLVAQTANDNHQYPDGIALFTGTLFAPHQDRDTKDMGFTHKSGDVVSISSAKLGTLQNRVTYSNQAPPWTFGISALMKNLSQRGLL